MQLELPGIDRVILDLSDMYGFDGQDLTAPVSGRSWADRLIEASKGTKGYVLRIG